MIFPPARSLELREGIDLGVGDVGVRQVPCRPITLVTPSPSGRYG